MSLEAQMNHLTAEIVELRSVVNALTAAITGLTQQAAEEIEHKRAPFIEVIKPDDPRYADEIKAFHQDSIFEPRLEVFADLKPSDNRPQPQGAITQQIPDKIPAIRKRAKMPRPDKGQKRSNYPAITYSRCCGAERRKRSKHDGKCVECR